MFKQTPLDPHRPLQNSSKHPKPDSNSSETLPTTHIIQMAKKGQQPKKRKNLSFPQQMFMKISGCLSFDVWSLNPKAGNGDLGSQQIGSGMG